ncbi:Lrp/AsnC family transcriptional regulator [Spongiactinospora rosea]|uniref:Lrp/AsnC family transcriptional regulator n=1 Tax=Spongiactinospora rosea TaxID=2248750 RepID=A0A366LQK7_9ACTN|nr:Lrp/AsnC family transcriptional regulator [Spongiactinospora rosea]RBQ16181.1 Lrp/AsnC family transcriptional regulator [Spongiactinospora rosea]
MDGRTRMPRNLDTVDREIIRLVSTQGRISHEEIARRVHVSRPAVHERVKRLESEGVIRGYRAVVEWSAVDLGLCAFVSVQADHDRLAMVIDRLFQMSTPEAVVEECHRVTGQWCALLKVRAASSLALQQLLDQIMSMSGVRQTITTIVLSSIEAAPGVR